MSTVSNSVTLVTAPAKPRSYSVIKDTEFFHTTAFGPSQRLEASRLPPEKRQWMVEKLIVKYPVFTQGFDMIAENHRPVAGGSHAKGTIGALIGDSHTGKSSICSYYAALHPPHTDDEGEVVPVVHLTATLGMRPDEFARAVNSLTIARQPRRSGGIGAFVDQSLLQLIRAKTELLLIDDAQYLFKQQPKGGAERMFKIIKAIADFKALAIVLVGEGDINDYVYSVPAFRNRAYNWMGLRGLTGGADDMQRFAGLLRGIDRRLPFANLSDLDSPLLIEDFYRYSGGMVGRLMNLIRPAAFRAFNDGSSHILIEHFRRVVATRVDSGDSHDYFGYRRHAA